MWITRVIDMEVHRKALPVVASWTVVALWAAWWAWHMWPDSGLSWHFSVEGSRLLLHGSGLNLFADAPWLQTGPLSLVVAALLGPLPANVGKSVALLGMAVAGPLLIAALAPLVAPAKRHQRIFIAAIVLIPAWTVLSVRWGHLDDVLAMIFAIVALRAVSAARPGRGSAGGSHRGKTVGSRVPAAAARPTVGPAACGSRGGRRNCAGLGALRARQPAHARRTAPAGRFVSSVGTAHPGRARRVGTGVGAHSPARSLTRSGNRGSPDQRPAGSVARLRRSATGTGPEGQRLLHRQCRTRRRRLRPARHRLEDPVDHAGHGRPVLAAIHPRLCPRTDEDNRSDSLVVHPSGGGRGRASGLGSRRHHSGFRVAPS